MKNKQPNPTFKKCVEIWLMEIHPGWTFGAIHGKKIKSILSKIKKVCQYSGLDGTDEQVIASFRKMCLQLPEYFKDKDLQVIDSKFNEIVLQIQKGKSNGQKWSSKTSTERFIDSL